MSEVLENNNVDFTDDEIQKMLDKFDSPEKIEQFYYILKLLIDDSIDDEQEVEFDVYVKRVKESESSSSSTTPKEDTKEDVIEDLE
jgi:tRNA uridine 5-carbamoylmethylation protein Kti12